MFSSECSVQVRDKNHSRLTKLTIYIPCQEFRVVCTTDPDAWVGGTPRRPYPPYVASRRVSSHIVAREIRVETVVRFESVVEKKTSHLPTPPRTGRRSYAAWFCVHAVP